MTSTLKERDLRESFRQSIRDNPGDNDTRLIFADWLEENGDGGKDLVEAKFHRDWVELGRYPRYGSEEVIPRTYGAEEHHWYRLYVIGDGEVLPKGSQERNCVPTSLISIMQENPLVVDHLAFRRGEGARFRSYQDAEDALLQAYFIEAGYDDQE